MAFAAVVTVANAVLFCGTQLAARREEAALRETREATRATAMALAALAHEIGEMRTIMEGEGS